MIYIIKDEWFSVNKIDDKTYVISEEQQWEKPNRYLLIGDEKVALIDTGLGVENIINVVKSITNLEIIVLTTHVHWDHIGCHNLFDNFGVHKLEESWNIESYEMFQGSPNFTYVDADVIDLGNRLIHIIHTPGHSPGHCCFYEEGKYLYTGDLVYAGKLDAYYPSTNPKEFYHSIEKLRALNYKIILLGHYDFPLEPSIIDRIYLAFRELDQNDALEKQNGIFKFEDFSIHI